MATLLLLTSSGCGTLLNIDGRDALIVDSRPLEEMRKHERPPYPFGGVANDMAWLNGAEEPIGVIGCVVDLPLSIAGDIVTLPWTAYQSLVVVQKRPDSASSAVNGNGSIPQEGRPVQQNMPPLP